MFTFSSMMAPTIRPDCHIWWRMSRISNLRQCFIFFFHRLFILFSFFFVSTGNLVGVGVIWLYLFFLLQYMKNDFYTNLRSLRVLESTYKVATLFPFTPTHLNLAHVKFLVNCKSLLLILLKKTSSPFLVLAGRMQITNVSQKAEDGKHETWDLKLN